MFGKTAMSETEEEDEAEILKALGSRDYMAFLSLRGRTRMLSRLFFVPRHGMLEWLGNGALWRIRAHPDGSQIGLTYHNAAVLIEGANLLGVALAIDRHACLFLQQHSPERHGAVQQGPAIITSIRFFDPVGDPLDTAAKGAKH
jgi:hypothetical protein